jgi:hypothetical protein
MLNVDKKAIIYDKEELMKLIIRVYRIIKKGDKAVKMKVKVKDLPDFGKLTKLLKNKVFRIVYDSAGVKEKYEVVDDLLVGGDTNTAIFPIINYEEVDSITDEIAERYEEAILGIKNLQNWRGGEEITYDVKGEEYGK